MFSVSRSELHNAPQESSRLRIEAGRRLVENKYLRSVQQRTGNVYPASLTAGELADCCGREDREKSRSSESSCKSCLRTPCPLCRTARRGFRDYRAPTAAYPARTALEHDAEPARYLRKYPDPRQGRRSSRCRCRPFRAGPHMMEMVGRFACAVYAEKGKKLAAGGHETDRSLTAFTLPKALLRCDISIICRSIETPYFLCCLVSAE